MMLTYNSGVTYSFNCCRPYKYVYVNHTYKDIANLLDIEKGFGKHIWNIRVVNLAAVLQVRQQPTVHRI
jgi:hypothetical protein